MICFRKFVKWISISELHSEFGQDRKVEAICFLMFPMLQLLFVIGFDLSKKKYFNFFYCNTFCCCLLRSNRFLESVVKCRILEVLLYVTWNWGSQWHGNIFFNDDAVAVWIVTIDYQWMVRHVQADFFSVVTASQGWERKQPMLWEV